MRRVFTISFFLCHVVSLAQTVQYNREQLDTLQIQSHLGAYQFDDIGTTKGKTETLTITYSKEKKNYVISDYTEMKYEGTFKPRSFDSKTKTIKKKIGTVINDTLVTQLTMALTSSENPRKTFSELTDKALSSYVKKKTILEVAKWYNLEWRFKMSYSTREENQAFYRSCQSLDTFKVYLSERFDSTGYSITTDYFNSIDIRVVTEKSEYNFEGQYPKPVKQPWYNKSESTFFAPSILNFSINRSLELILPNDFLLKSTISEEALMFDYMTWYFERRNMKY
jgi:hypothetical protein